MSPHGEDEYFMKSPRLSLARGEPHCTHEAKPEKDVDEQQRDKQEASF